MADTTGTIDHAGGSAATQGDLWGERARDWAEVLEGWNGWGVPLYRHILERVTVQRGTRLLDMGCGAGRFCRIAADRGAHISGLDATGTFVQIARKRIPVPSSASRDSRTRRPVLVMGATLHRQSRSE